MALRVDGSLPLLYELIKWRLMLETKVDYPGHFIRALRDDNILTGDGALHDAHGAALLMACVTGIPPYISSRIGIAGCNALSRGLCLLISPKENENVQSRVLEQVLSLKFKLDMKCIRDFVDALDSLDCNQAPKIAGLLIDKAGVEVLNDAYLLRKMCHNDNVLKEILKRPGTFPLCGMQL
jgi:hypothetical protein